MSINILTMLGKKQGGIYVMHEIKEYGENMEIKDINAIKLALNACTGIINLAMTTKNDSQSKQNLLSALEAVKEVLDILENGKRDKNADMAYSILYDCYHRAFDIVNGNLTPETKN